MSLYRLFPLNHLFYFISQAEVVVLRVHNQSLHSDITKTPQRFSQQRFKGWKATFVSSLVLLHSCQWSRCYRVESKLTRGVVGGIDSDQSNLWTPHCSRRTTVVITIINVIIITVHRATCRTLQDLHHWRYVAFSQSTVNVNITYSNAYRWQLKKYIYQQRCISEPR